jgi:ATP/maltotriose-dependent transcriptional regulator MalT
VVILYIGVPLQWQAGSLDVLCDVLAREVFERQPADVRDFLLITATLRDLPPEACNALRRASDSAAMLACLKRQDLFVVETAEGALRYYHIFHNFLRQQSAFAQRCVWNHFAATYLSNAKMPRLRSIICSKRRYRMRWQIYWTLTRGRCSRLGV